MSEEAKHDKEFIVFRLGDLDYCIDIKHVREIRGWTAATPIPHSQSYMLGFINLRGSIIPVLDLASRFGMPPAVPNERNAIIVTELGTQATGVLVDAVSDIISIDEEIVQSTPELASTLAKAFVQGVVALEGRMISVVSIENVFPRVQDDAA